MVCTNTAKKALEIVKKEIPTADIKIYFNLRYNGYLRILKQIKPKSKVLEVGMGSGYVSIAASTLGCKVKCINFRKSPKDELLKKYGITYKVLDAERHKFDYPSDSFDYVLFTEVMEHFLFSPEHCLKEILRVLKPGGKLICTVPNSISLIKRVYPWFHIPPNTIKTFYTLLYDKCGIPYFNRHNRLFTLKETTKFFKKIGFRIANGKYIALDEKIYQINSMHYEHKAQFKYLIKPKFLTNYIMRKIWRGIGFFLISGRSHVEVIGIKP